MTEKPNFQLDPDVLRQVYTTMLRIRAFEDKTAELFKEGVVKGTAHSYKGQEAIASGGCAALKDGDMISIDAEAGRLDIELDESELAERRKTWQPRQHDFQSGTLWKYAATVGPAHEGAVTPPGGKAETHSYADI